ncbi:hypothetical protein ACVWWO_003089 [Bradyrhizobium sp. F1.13.1]
MTTIWEACAGKKWCIHIPFDGDKCLEARACIRVIAEGSDLFLEIEIAGNRQRIPMGNSCVEARYYVFAARACLGNFNRTSHSIEFDIILRLCIDANIGPIHIGECVDVYRQHVSIGTFTVDELTQLGFDHPVVTVRKMAAEPAYAYVETAISADATKNLETAFAGMK